MLTVANAGLPPIISTQDPRNCVQSAQPTHRPSHGPSKETVSVLGLPSIEVAHGLSSDTENSGSVRSYTPLKVIGDGSFGTVWLVDWHTQLPPDTPLSPMQCGAGARAEWSGKRLVALKRMKRRWEGGWEECKKLKELESLRAIPRHPNIIPLYDFFLLPTSKELYFVFESMEGNLYQLIKSRKGRPLAGGLISSIFRQVVAGLHHIHSSGYFHRDMKPENLLVTTTGLFDYRNISAHSSNTTERDVIVIVKLADFGLARETESKPPYTEYVSTRWYRAPEVLLRSRDYSNPVDMWALGTIMAELINLKPLFPGSGEVDQVARICEVLGDPAEEYMDADGHLYGGGRWTKGIRMARSVGFNFPKIKPVPLVTLFNKNVPLSMISCIAGLLRYDPDRRHTSRECLEHPYIAETSHSGPPHSFMAISTGDVPPRQELQPRQDPVRIPLAIRLPDTQPQSLFISAPPLPAMVVADQKYAHENTPAFHLTSNSPTKSPHQAWSGESLPNPTYVTPEVPPAGGVTRRKLGFPKMHNKWGFSGMFGHSDKSQHPLPPLDELSVIAAQSPPSLKRSQSCEVDSSLSLQSTSQYGQLLDIPLDDKSRRKEAQRVALEAEKAKRALAEKRSREQARAVIQKRNQIINQTSHGVELDWESTRATSSVRHPKGPSAQTSVSMDNSTRSLSASTSFHTTTEVQPKSRGRQWHDYEHRLKARRRDTDDDHSMSSSDIPSNGRLSISSLTTVDSDPGPNRLRARPSLYKLNRMFSSSSLRTSFDEGPSGSVHSSAASYEFDPTREAPPRSSYSSTPDPTMLSLSDPSSPPAMQHLSLSVTPSGPSNSMHHFIPPQISPSPEFDHEPTQYVDMEIQDSKPQFDFNQAINPIFQVSSGSTNVSVDRNQTPLHLPPFSQLATVAELQPPLSPMSFRSPDES